MPQPETENGLELSEKELEDAEQRSAVRAHVIHEAIRRQGEGELKRPTSALAWSGLAAGLSMGFSLTTEGLLRSHLPDAPWRPLIAKLGYSIGFLVVILGRQQLFTENTLTAVLPVMHSCDRPSFVNLLRLWIAVLISNLAGAVAFAWVAAHTAVFRPDVKQAFLDIARESVGLSFSDALLRGIFAAWLIALVVWVLPFAEAGRVAVIIILTWLVAIGGFTHVVAGSIEYLYAVASGAASWQSYLTGYLAPVLIGNIIGGTSLVAALNHAQVVAGNAESGR